MRTHDYRFAEACVLAQERAFVASRRLKAANEELDAAEREHRLAYEALDEAERLYYRRPVRVSAVSTTGENNG